ncbi:MAG: T9SS type A sorting domain-containing protein [Ignavibacteriaceae bacterium]|jgi:hypothetical protein
MKKMLAVIMLLSVIGISKAQSSFIPKARIFAGDGKVFLSWDNKAEDWRNPFLGYEYDENGNPAGFKKVFEGYLIYRSKDAHFSDIKIITDSKGNPVYWKPIAQFDLVDSIFGPDPVGINGAHFWRGDDTGLQNAYIDNKVQNGQKYYYAVVSYTKGEPNFGTLGLQPEECTKVITEDNEGNLRFIDKNCGVVFPNPPPAGDIPPQIIGDTKAVAKGIGTGSIDIKIFDPAAVLEGASYSLKFKSDSLLYNYNTLSYNVVRSYQGVDSTVLSGIDKSVFGANKLSPVFDGLSVSVLNDTGIALIYEKTGWVVGNSNANLVVLQDISPISVRWPADYEIEFYDHTVDSSFIKEGPYIILPVNFRIKNVTENRYVKFAMTDPDKSGTLSIGDELIIIESKGTKNAIVWKIVYSRPEDPSTVLIDPAPGDIFRIATTRRFYTNDEFKFTTKAMVTDVEEGGRIVTFNLEQNYPNPFNPTTMIKYDVVNSGNVSLKVYDVLGNEVATLVNEEKQPGSYEVEFQSAVGSPQLASGIYFYQLRAGEFVETKKMILIR